MQNNMLMKFYTPLTMTPLSGSGTTAASISPKIGLSRIVQGLQQLRLMEAHMEELGT
jgi:hypothetical protein